MLDLFNTVINGIELISNALIIGFVTYHPSLNLKCLMGSPKLSSKILDFTSSKLSSIEIAMYSIYLYYSLFSNNNLIYFIYFIQYPLQLAQNCIIYTLSAGEIIYSFPSKSSRLSIYFSLSYSLYINGTVFRNDLNSSFTF